MHTQEKEARLSKTLLWLLGLIAFAILGYFCVYPHNHHIQSDVNDRTASALRQAGLDAKVQTDNKPIAGNDTPIAMQKHRRIEFNVEGI